jgi:hypothetical protein
VGITTYDPGVDGYVDAPATNPTTSVDLQGDGYGSLFIWGPATLYAVGNEGYVWPYPTEADRYVQKVWDPLTGDWEKWETVGYADYSGQEYPFGQTQYAGTSQYRVIEIFHTRNVI